MIADNIEKIQRDSSFHEDTYFEVVFSDDSTVDERTVNWSAISEENTVTYMGALKLVMVCKFPVKTIRIVHDSLTTDVTVPEGCGVYQAFKSESLFNSKGEKILDRINGRIVGLVKDGEVIEERFLDGRGNQVIGFKK